MNVALGGFPYTLAVFALCLSCPVYSPRSILYPSSPRRERDAVDGRRKAVALRREYSYRTLGVTN